jgi:hypothetical protein
MSIFDILRDAFSEPTDRPILVDTDNNLYVEEPSTDNEPSVLRPYQGFTSYGSSDSNDSMDDDSDI